MANPEHLTKLREGVKAWNAWRDEHPDTIPDLSDAKLSNADLEQINLKYANLNGADLGGATLSSAKLTGASLVRVHLHSANLIFAGLRGANLEHACLLYAKCAWTDLGGANLSWADVQAAVFHNAILDGSDFTNAAVHTTVFADTDLSAVKGLEAVRHNGPSSVGIDTISAVYRVAGNLPESFLRGCGVPDEFITFAKSLVATPIEFYSCFISYAFKDQAFADRLYADLQNKGVRCWFAPHDVQGGKKLHEQIDEAIRLHDKLLLILSPHSMESEWVKTEIAKARKREVRDPEGVLKRRVLFPIRLASFETLRDWECFDGDTGKDSAREIREYFIPDFSNWKNHDSYQEAFKRLIGDLKASDSKLK